MFFHRLLFLIFLSKCSYSLAGSIPLSNDESDTEMTAGDSATSQQDDDTLNQGLRQYDLRDTVAEMEILPSKNITLKKGESFKFYLHSKTDFSSPDSYPDVVCTWQLPSHVDFSGNCIIHNVDEAKDWESLAGKNCDDMHDQGIRPNEYWKYKFYGPNLNRDCGIEIKNASRWDNGIWTSSVEGAPSDGAFIYVKAPPLSIAYKNLPDVEEDQDFESGNATFRLEYDEGFNANWTVQCEQLDTRPAATVTWMIDNERLEVNDTMIDRYVEDANDKGDLSLNVIDVLYYVPKPNHDGKELRCVYDHEAYNQHDPSESREASVFLTIEAVPDPEEAERLYGGDGAIIGKELILEIKFHSRPPPHFEEFAWYPYDLEEPIENTTTIGRYTADNITEIGDSTYVARLRVSELLEEDEGREMTVKVFNDVGYVNLTITLDNLEEGGLATGAIAGIVVGVLVLIVLVAAIAYYMMKKNKKSKSTVTHTTSGVSTIPNVGRVNPTPVTDSEKNSEAA